MGKTIPEIRLNHADETAIASEDETRVVTSKSSESEKTAVEGVGVVSAVVATHNKALAKGKKITRAASGGNTDAITSNCATNCGPAKSGCSRITETESDDKLGESAEAVLATVNSGGNTMGAYYDCLVNCNKANVRAS